MEEDKIPYILNGDIFRIESRNGDNVTVRCLYCKGRHRGSMRFTGNFTRHIKVRHPSNFFYC